MLVQRLTERLAQVFSRLAAWLRAVFARLAPGERWRGAEASPGADGLSTQQSGSWLDDAHRLRPRRAALATADPNRGKHAVPGEQRPTPYAGTPTHPIIPPAPTPAPTPTPTQEPRPGRPWVFPAHPMPPQPHPRPQPAPSASDGASDGDEAQARRRLISLKYLVRIGLYNEGFAPSAVPEQYQRSLGTDDEG